MFFAQPQAFIKCTCLFSSSALGSSPCWQAGSGFGAAVGFQAPLHLHVPCSFVVGNPYSCLRNCVCREINLGLCFRPGFAGSWFVALDFWGYENSRAPLVLKCSYCGT